MKKATKKVSIPATRNPFINAQLIPAGVDPVTGEERFWTSALNYIDGCLGALVKPSGEHRLYRFSAERDERLFYGAAYAGNDIMWLSSFLDSITRLNLITGETETFMTGMPHSLSVSGFVYDDATQKVFWASYCQDDMKRKGLSFDTVTKTVTKVFDDIGFDNKQPRYVLGNTDGTYTLICVIPDIDLFIWDPVTDKTEVILRNLKRGTGYKPLDYSVAIQRNDGAVYLPAYGWFDPMKRSFTKGSEPSSEAAWFGMDSQFAYGSKTTGLVNTGIFRWKLATGEVELIAEVPDAVSYSFRLSENRKIICVNLYGFFYRVDAATGKIEKTVKFDSDGIGHIDCVYRINDERLLCTPFITQRFAEINLRTGEGIDLGRATGGLGEVLEVTGMNNKIYMASYTKGQLVEYDPAIPAGFPENPKIVVEPGGRAMRPVAMCIHNETIYYSCSNEYGFLGSVMIRYTPSSGKTVVTENPVENQMIRSLEYDENLDKLIAASTYHADCRSCVPTDDFCMLAVLDPDTMMPEKSIKVYSEQDYLFTFGQLSDGRYLCGAAGAHRELEDGYTFYELDILNFKIKPYELPEELVKRKPKCIVPTGGPGVYVCLTKDSVDLWNLSTGRLIRQLCENPGAYKVFVQDGTAYLVCKREIHVITLG